VCGILYGGVPEFSEEILIASGGSLASALEFSQDHPLAPLKPNRKNQMKNQLITRNYNDLTFTFRDDGYFNMTKAAMSFGKKLSHFQDSPDTVEYVAALSELTGLAPRNPGNYIGGLKSNHRTSALVVVVPGNRYVVDCGTWAHPKLATFFARWLDVRFAVWCDAMIEDILKGNAGPWWFMEGRWGVLRETEEILPSLTWRPLCKFAYRPCIQFFSDDLNYSAPHTPPPFALKM